MSLAISDHLKKSTSLPLDLMQQNKKCLSVSVSPVTAGYKIAHPWVSSGMCPGFCFCFGITGSILGESVALFYASPCR